MKKFACSWPQANRQALLSLLIAPLALAGAIGMSAGCKDKRPQASENINIPAEPSPAGSPTPPVPTADTAATNPAVAPATGKVILSVNADFDGKPGDEKIELRADGALTAGALAGMAEASKASEYWMGKQASLTVVVLDTQKGIKGILLGLPVDEEEDPPNYFQLFVAQGDSLVRVFSGVVSSYGPGAIKFAGDGTLRYVEDGWAACHRAKMPEKKSVALQEVIFQPDHTGQFKEATRANTKATQVCDELAACPFVDVVTADGGQVRMGEILRNVRGKQAYALQTLALGRSAIVNGAVTVRLSEEKREVTLLDEVYIVVDDAIIRPTSCRHASRASDDASDVPAYCIADHVPFRMYEHDVLTLTFAVPVDAANTAPTLHARGYYIPTPTGRTTRAQAK